MYPKYSLLNPLTKKVEGVLRTAEMPKKATLVANNTHI